MDADFVAQEDRLRDRFRGALIGTMVGDTLGADVEGEAPHILAQHIAKFADYEAVMSPGGMLTGKRALTGSTRYTDDTQMALGLAESLSERGVVNEVDLARRFATNFEASRGYGSGASFVLLRLREGAPWDKPARELFNGNGSYGNGAAMRIAPLGVFYFQAERSLLRRMATRSSRVTHTHVLGIEGAVLQAAAVGQAVRAALVQPANFDPLRFLAGVESVCRDDCEEYLGKFDHIRRFLKGDRPTPIQVAEAIGNGIDAVTSVPAALCAFLLNPDSFVDAVRFAVTLGGDTDTIGAMCGAITGAYHGYSAIPDDWLSPLENGAKGHAYARELADRLFLRWWQENANAESE